MIGSEEFPSLHQVKGDQAERWTGGGDMEGDVQVHQEGGAG